jgi:hypothetical protein
METTLFAKQLKNASKLAGKVATYTQSPNLFLGIRDQKFTVAGHRTVKQHFRAVDNGGTEYHEVFTYYSLVPKNGKKKAPFVQVDKKAWKQALKSIKGGKQDAVELILSGDTLHLYQDNKGEPAASVTVEPANPEMLPDFEAPKLPEIEIIWDGEPAASVTVEPANSAMLPDFEAPSCRNS